jgi:amino acid transporter
MALIAVVFSFMVAWIASKGAGASTSVNLAINVIQISALMLFSVLALGYRVSHPAGATAFQYDGQTLATYTYQFATAKDGSIVRDASGVPAPLLDTAGKPVPFTIDYPEKDASGNFLTHKNAASVIAPHQFSFLFIQATVAVLILVGFESVTAMGGEAKNPTKHIPIAVISSLLIQGLICYLIEYFAANYFLNSGYTMQSAASSAAPIGDMMIIVGDGLLGHGNGKYFMLGEAFTVFLALIGTTLSCMNLCDGKRQRSSRALRHLTRQVAHSAPRHLGSCRDLVHHRCDCSLPGLWRRWRSLRRCHCRAAARHLLQLRLFDA